MRQRTGNAPFMPAPYAAAMNEFDILQSAASGMDAQRAALDVAARNVAAAEATGAPGRFERLVPRFDTGPSPEDVPEPNGPGDDGPEDSADAGDSAGFGDPGGFGSPAIRYLGAVPERGADVDAVTEMVAVLDAQRAYESDASVFDVGKRLAERTIDVGRLQ
jgi:flagellar basal-body rod protein FlgC